MHMLDILDKDGWKAMEDRIRQETGLTATVYDQDGVGVTGTRTFCNRLCPSVREHGKALSGVCAVAHQNMAAAAARKGGALVDECDAGLVKICAPVMSGGSLVGVIGGCGLLLEDGEVETFGLSMLTGMEDEELAALAEDIPVISREEAESMARSIADMVRDLPV